MGLPTKNAQLIAAIAAASAKITATPEDYGFDADGATALATAVTAAENSLDDAETYKTLKESKVSAANAALTEVEDLFRSMQQQARFNPDVTDEKLADIGASRRVSPSRVGAPASAPELSLEGLGIGSAKLRLIEPNTRSAALPESAIGYEISLVDGSTDATEGEADMGVKTFVSKSRCTISTDVGKPALRVYARYVGRRAQYGPWSMPLAFSPPKP